MEQTSTSFLALIRSVATQRGEDVAQLDKLLKSWSLKRVCTPGDGSCLFMSVAYSLIQRIQSEDTRIVHILQQLGIPEENFKGLTSENGGRVE